jgi:23S rRNA pseudouridine1911/1915/1917 synthase
MKVKIVTINHRFVYTKEIEERLDKYLAGQFPDLSRSRIQKWIDDGNVQVNDLRPNKSGVKLEINDVILVNIPEPVPTTITAESIQLDVLFENEDVIVINKPAGMVVHPSAGHSSGTLVNAALGYAPEMEGIAGEGRPGIVHRLDKDTSGILIMAKNDQSLRWLQQQFKQRTIDKVYIALVDRHPPTPDGKIEAAIGRDPNNRKRMSVVSDQKGREAVSLYTTLRSYQNHTLLEVHPLTGRTHQIRVHLAYIGCPVAGDTVYGYRHPSVPIRRHFLHATRLQITLPGENTPRLFNAPLDDELKNVLDILP